MEKENNKLDKLIKPLLFIGFGMLCMSLQNLVCTDTDILWHYKLGADIVKNHSLSCVNSYSFLDNTYWIHYEWLYEVILYLVVSTFGYIGYLALFGINQSVLAYTIYKINTNNKTSNNYLLLCALTFLMLFSLPRNFANRPSEFSVYTIILIIYLYNHKKKYSNLYFFLFGLFIANFHGANFLILTVIYIIMIVSDLFVDIYNNNKIKVKYYGKKLLNLLIFLVGTLINPSGYKMHYETLKTSSLDSTQYIQEWGSTPPGYIVGIIIVVIAMSFGYEIHKNGLNKKNTQIIMLCSALLIASLNIIRVYLIFGVVWLVYGYQYTEVLLHDILSSILVKFKVLLKLKVLIPALSAILICIPIITLEENTDYIDKMNTNVSVEILNELKNNYTDETKILASYNYGNYLIANNMKCFIDSRCVPYAKELGTSGAVDELFYICNNSYDTDAINIFLDKYKFDYIWISEGLKDIEYAIIDDNNYELILTDKVNNKDNEYNDNTDEIYDRNIKNTEKLYKRKDN